MLVISLLRNQFKSSLLRVPTRSPSLQLARRTFVSRSVMHSPARITPSHTPGPRSRILVLGAGNFGSCLADHLGDTEHDVFMWSREEDLVKYFNENQRNIRYLTDHAFAKKIRAIGPEMPDATFIKGIDVILFAIPTEGVRSTLEKLRSSLDPATAPLLIFVNKGIETSTNQLTLEIIADACGKEIARQATFLSGPSFAKEIVRRQPTMVSIASLSNEHAERASGIFHQPWFRCYTGGDVIGIELAGALKNVYAIATGIADGLGYENNTRASLITRGLAEMTRIGTAYGANPLTFLSLAGVGDLFLTCSSPTSRNYTVGFRLGQGEKLDDIIRTLGSVAEGVTTSKGLKAVIDELGVEAPIAAGVYGVLYEGKNVESEARALMEYPPSKELDFSATAGLPARKLMAKLGLPGDTQLSS
ncbi:glycerol-3-phosphate dehydrogenase [Peniophora sp. CONT]|nr:glycerol-3-phosphate dehydrogenase [Peniophora sp. CONT]